MPIFTRRNPPECPTRIIVLGGVARNYGWLRWSVVFRRNPHGQCARARSCSGCPGRIERVAPLRAWAAFGRMTSGGMPLKALCRSAASPLCVTFHGPHRSGRNLLVSRCGSMAWAPAHTYRLLACRLAQRSVHCLRKASATLAAMNGATVPPMLWRKLHQLPLGAHRLEGMQLQDPPPWLV